MKLIGGDIMSNTINWLDSNRLFALLNTTMPEGYGATGELRRIMQETGMNQEDAQRIMDSLAEMEK